MKLEDLLTEKREYTKQDITSLLKLTDKDIINKLYKFADGIREEYVGNSIDIQGIICFSNYCDNNCLYCPLRRSNLKAERSRLDIDKITESALQALKLGYKSIILRSGEDSFYDIETLVNIIKAIKLATGQKITLSIGERPEIEYRMMREAGAEGYFMRHETSDPILYRQLHPELKYSNRIRCLRAIKQAGFITGGGIEVGLPGQTLESIANDILLFKTMDVDSITIEPYIPHPDTPLARRLDEAGGYFVPALGYYDIAEMIYKIIAITRIIMKKADITVNDSLSQLDNNRGRISALKCGANVVLTNITNQKLVQDFQIAPNKIVPANKIMQELKSLKR